MAHRIYVRASGEDTRAEVRLSKIKQLFPGIAIRNLFLVDNYTITKNIPPEGLEKTSAMLTQPVVEVSSIDKPLLPGDFSWSFEIGFLPGVTDNVGHTVREGIGDLLKTDFGPGEDVYFSQTTFLLGDLSLEDVKGIAKLFYNPLIQHVDILITKDWAAKNKEYYVPTVTLPPPAEPLEIDLDIPEEELLKLGKEGITDPKGHRRGPLALDGDSLTAIRKHFANLGRKPTDIELESIAQTWSEHCKHTIFAAELDELKEGLYRNYIKAATETIRKAKGEDDFCVSVFSDNSGAIEFDDKYLVTDKVETHNSPCALDPFGGAITGIVGVNRDAIGCGLGAKPVVNRYGFCFADPRNTETFFRDKELKDPLLSARRILEGVVSGVNEGGNCSGIPTPQGFVTFDKRYRGKPLVFVGTVGLLPKKTAGRAGHKKTAQPGDVIVMTGGKVGRDGIHGATFSSEALNSGSPATAVQIGDPITQKKLSDAIVKEARDLNLYNSITDNGAGGLSCSVAEMARECGGCRVDLDKIPLKYPGLEPWQIWISESQERMTLAVPPDKLDQIIDLFKRRGVEATPIGRFDSSRRCCVTQNNKIIMDLDLEFLHNGLPDKCLTTRQPPAPVTEDPPSLPEDYNEALLDLMTRPNITSFSFISRQYDHEVQGSSVLKPLAGKGEVNTHSSVVCPILGSEKGIALSQALFPSYGDLDHYAMAACAIDASVRQVITCGGTLNKLALLDNTCWCSSDDPVRLWQLKNAIKACYDYAIYFGTPFISGKDSMFNDFSGFDKNGKSVKISVPPTILISSIGIVNNVTLCVSIDFKRPGDLVYILGETRAELGATEFLSWWGEKIRGRPYPGSKVPHPSDDAKQLYSAYELAVQKGFVTSAESTARGGVAISLARQAVAGKLGVNINLDLFSESKRLNAAEILFSETASRIVCTVDPANREGFENIFQGVQATCIGQVEENNFTVFHGGKNIITLSIDSLYKAYHSTFQEY